MRWLVPFVVLSLVASVAAADAISGPPDDCPAGSEGTSSHSGTWCQLRPACQSDDECESGSSCDALSICVLTETYTQGGLLPPGLERRELSREVAVSECERDADCAAPATCRSVRVCRPSLARAFHPRNVGCDCGVGAVPPAQIGGGVAVVAFAILGLWLGRRPR